MFAAAHRWILKHDDSKVFVVLYIGLAVLLAIFLGLFWLALVVAVHLLMEMVKQHHFDSRPLPVLTRSLWELKLDIGLVLCGLVIGLYIEVFFSLVGIGHAGRAGAPVAARAGMWPRVIRGVLLTLDDVALVAKGAALRKNEGVDAEVDEVDREEAIAKVGVASALAATGTQGDTLDSGPSGAQEDAHPGSALWGDWIAPRWSLGDRLSLGFAVLNLLLIIVAPLLTPHTLAGAWTEILEELRPFP